MGQRTSDIRATVARAKQGDQAALAVLVRTYSPRVYNLTLRMLRNPQDAEDALQETFITMINKIATFDQRSDCFTWLYRVATNVCLMRIRKTRSEKRIDSIDTDLQEEAHRRELTDWAIRPDEAAHNAELKRRLDKAIHQLPDIYRAVFVLRDVEGLSIKETQKILNLTASNVKIRLTRARLFLREMLAPYMEQLYA